jgi:hypothetical protein
VLAGSWLWLHVQASAGRMTGACLPACRPAACLRASLTVRAPERPTHQYLRGYAVSFTADVQATFLCVKRPWDDSDFTAHLSTLDVDMIVRFHFCQLCDAMVLALHRCIARGLSIVQEYHAHWFSSISSGAGHLQRQVFSAVDGSPFAAAFTDFQPPHATATCWHV